VAAETLDHGALEQPWERPVAQDFKLPEIVREGEESVLEQWLTLQKSAGPGGGGRVSDADLKAQCREFLSAFIDGLSGSGLDIEGPGYARLRQILSEVSRTRAQQGFSPTDTARFVFSLKEPLFERIRAFHTSDPAALAADTWAMSTVLDRLGLHTTELYQKSRDEVIMRQQEEIAELSTPVVKLWEGVLALPLIGTLDSARTQVVMENLLQSIVDTGSAIAIIDITGVPTVDTLVAQHLLKTISAARLMGADCIISGIRPQIAQTMVHLGVELNVVSKASLADAFGLALRRTGRKVVADRALAAVAAPVA
jgi:rsbT co-antagonist protein RsbR